MEILSTHFFPAFWPQNKRVLLRKENLEHLGRKEVPGESTMHHVVPWRTVWKGTKGHLKFERKCHVLRYATSG